MCSILNVLSVKATLGIVFVCAVVIVDINIHVLNDGIPHMQYRCSADHPEFSIVLDLWMTLPDGSLQVSDGTVYPPGASWEKGGVVRGCPCTVKSCPVKNCKQILSEDYQRLISSFVPQILSTTTNLLPLRELIFHATSPATSEDSMTFTEKEYHTNIHDENKIFAILDDQYDVAILLGQLLHHITTINSGTHAIEYLSLVPQCDADHEKHIPFKTDNSSFTFNGIADVCFLTRENAFLEAFSCTRNDWLKHNRQTFGFKKWWPISCVIFALIVHLTTIMMFATVPSLKKANNQYIYCYLLAQITRKLSMIVMRFVTTRFQMFDAILFGVSYYGSLSSKFWQLAIAHSMWMIFRCQRLLYSKKSFMVYSGFAWTVPLICSVVVVMGIDKDDEAEISKIGSIAAFVPGLLVEVCCMVLCGLTVCRLKDRLKEDKELRNVDCKRHNAREVRWSILLVKVILLDVGLEYIIFTVLTIARMRYFWSEQPFPLSPIWYNIPQDFNNLRGVQIFYFFVLKKDVLKYLFERCGDFHKAHPRANKQ